MHYVKEASHATLHARGVFQLQCLCVWGHLYRCFNLNKQGFSCQTASSYALPLIHSLHNTQQTKNIQQFSE